MSVQRVPKEMWEDAERKFREWYDAFFFRHPSGGIITGIKKEMFSDTDAIVKAETAPIYSLGMRKVKFDADNFATVVIDGQPKDEKPPEPTPEPRRCSICHAPIRGGYCLCT